MIVAQLMRFKREKLKTGDDITDCVIHHLSSKLYPIMSSSICSSRINPQHIKRLIYDTVSSSMSRHNNNIPKLHSADDILNKCVCDSDSESDSGDVTDVMHVTDPISINISIHMSNDRSAIPPISPGIRTLILRNLPRDITVQHLRIIFDRYGPILDVYIPKNMDRSSLYYDTIKGFALIKFLNPNHCASAFIAEYGQLMIGRNHIHIEFAKRDFLGVKKLN